MSKFSRLSELAQYLFRLVLTAAMVVMIALVFFNVVLRYGFHSGLKFSAEVSQLIFVWMVMIGAVMCFYTREHLELRMMEALLPTKASFILRRFIYLFMAIACAFLVYGSINQVSLNWTNAMAISRIPLAYMHLSGVVAGFAMGVIALWRTFIPPKDELQEETES
ncbi:TRAP transporter small permease [Rhodobacteraceae bacterium RKSG542]|uniref:TRAP transporter small permease n=1 Tax=Pseudovibrio flavus TaxID=2529854 RepID=UPI0012BC0781|nr:TRAP transporter small permease [Pseudovibrio flavus]MTI18115.1 TRAP transporter small permease [Pseudovibrio flavus]